MSLFDPRDRLGELFGSSEGVRCTTRTIRGPHFVDSLHQKGKGENKKLQWVETGISHADLFSKCNKINIYYVIVHTEETFPQGTLSEEPLERRPQWFNFGATITVEKTDVCYK